MHIRITFVRAIIKIFIQVIFPIKTFKEEQNDIN
jgi:hypothetical protein